MPHNKPKTIRLKKKPRLTLGTPTVRRRTLQEKARFEKETTPRKLRVEERKVRRTERRETIVKAVAPTKVTGIDIEEKKAAGKEILKPIVSANIILASLIPAGKVVKFLTKNKNLFPFIADKEIKASALKAGVNLDKKQLGQVRFGLGKARVQGVTDRLVANRFPSNSKKVSLTQKLWLGLGIGVSAAFAAKDIYGTYPYAEFIGKEEALQTVGIPIFLAIQAGDLEGAEQLIAEQKEIMASDLGKVPYKNVRNAIEDYVEAQAEAIIEFERLIAKARGEIEFEGTSTGEDIAARDVEQAKLQEERDVEFEEGQKERDIKKADELEFESEFFRLIREGRQAEADDLQKAFVKKLRE